MSSNHTAQLAAIRTFPALIKYLRDEMGWPIGPDSFEDLTFDFEPEELGIDAKNAAKISEIKRLRPLSSGQPFGIFFVKFEPKRLPVVALRRILSQVVLKKRATAKAAEHAAWAADDLLFVSNYGEGDARHISFAHFSTAEDGTDLPTLKVLGWDNLDTPLHLGAVAERLKQHLSWPNDEEDAKAWRQAWRGAFDLRHREVINTSQTLSVRLAELARAIRNRIRTALAIETEKGPLTRLMKAFQDALVHDLDADGFADMYAQTIAYGLLSSRIANPKARTADDFAAHMRTNPLLRELMQTFLQAGGRRGRAGGPEIDFDELGVSEVVSLLDQANMEAVLRDFGDRNPLEDPVIHFYELFLSEYDAEKRMQRGVFYTPRPVVAFIVRSVDELLRTKFGLADGLADTTTWGDMARRTPSLKIPNGISEGEPFVQILDPATGTGTFLVEVIGQIEATMRRKWLASRKTEAQIAELWNEYVPKHLLPRLHAFELMMAPYAIAHLKVGLKLYETGYRFSTDQRAQVYLTNALEPASDSRQTKLSGIIAALAHEATAVDNVKRKKRFTVVIGNPPYAGNSSNMSATAQGLVDRYRSIDGTPLNEKKLWLQNDYVKFLAFADKMCRDSGVGCIGYITDASYLDGPTFRGLRANLAADFHTIDVVNLNGSAKRRKAQAIGDQNVFDITQSVAILVASRTSETQAALYRVCDMIGSRELKYAQLAQGDARKLGYVTLDVRPPFYEFVTRSSDGEEEYNSFIPINQIFVAGSVGIQTSRDHLAVDFSRPELLAKIDDFAKTKERDATIRERYFPGKKVGEYLAGDTRGWSLSDARKAIARMPDPGKHVIQLSYRPLDTRYLFYSPHLVDWPRPEVSDLMIGGDNIGLCVLRRTENDRPYDYFSVSRTPISNHQVSLKDGTYLYPLLATDPGIVGRAIGKRINFRDSFIAKLAAARDGGAQTKSAGGAGSSDVALARGVFNYIYAIFHSLEYRGRYEALLKIDFPRVPLPNSGELFERLATLGSRLVHLHLFEDQTCKLEGPQFVGPKSPLVARIGWAQGAVWLDMPAAKSQAHRGGTIGFVGVPSDVWNFCIGGFQVCEKWLKDRKGRILSTHDIAHYQKIVAAIAETIRVMGEIDTVIDEHGGWPGAFAVPVNGG